MATSDYASVEDKYINMNLKYININLQIFNDKNRRRRRDQQGECHRLSIQHLYETNRQVTPINR